MIANWDPINAQGYCTCGQYSGDGTPMTCAAHPAAVIAPPAPTRWPFRCPICEGRGFVFEYEIAKLSTGDTDTITCPTCHGARIIWSPPA